MRASSAAESLLFLCACVTLQQGVSAASPTCLDGTVILARKQPDEVEAHRYYALEPGKLNWGVGPCFRKKSAEQCQQLCDADATCVGYEVGTSAAHEEWGYSCCLEFCRPPDSEPTPFADADVPVCECWSNDKQSQKEEDVAKRLQWTYHLKGGLASEPEAGSGPEAVEGSCAAQNCNSDYYGDCCAPNGEIQSCRTAGLYPVSIGTCDNWYGMYTCCPAGVRPARIEHTRPRGSRGSSRSRSLGFGFWQISGIPMILLIVIICSRMRRRAQLAQAHAHAHAHAQAMALYAGTEMGSLHRASFRSDGGRPSGYAPRSSHGADGLPVTASSPPPVQGVPVAGGSIPMGTAAPAGVVQGVPVHGASVGMLPTAQAMAVGEPAQASGASGRPSVAVATAVPIRQV